MTPSSSCASLSTLASEAPEPPKPVSAPQKTEAQKQRYNICTKPPVPKATVAHARKPAPVATGHMKAAGAHAAAYASPQASPHGITFMTETTFDECHPPQDGVKRKKTAVAVAKKEPVVVHESNAQLSSAQIEELLRQVRKYKGTVMAIIGEKNGLA